MPSSTKCCLVSGSPTQKIISNNIQKYPQQKHWSLHFYVASNRHQQQQWEHGNQNSIATKPKKHQSNHIQCNYKNNPKPQYAEEKETEFEKTGMEMKTNNLIHFLKSESSRKIVILSESNIQMIGDHVNVIPKFLVEQICDNMNDMQVEDARVSFQDIDSVGNALVASFAESIAKEDCNDECVEYTTVVATSAIVNVCVSGVCV